MRRKLTADQVEGIATSTESSRALGQRYGVSNRTISEVRTGRRHASVRRPIQDNTYLVGDALKRMKALPDGFCPTIVTSPPYNLGAGRSGNQSNWAASDVLREGYDQHDDAMTPLKYRNWQRRILAECCRVAGPEGSPTITNRASRTSRSTGWALSSTPLCPTAGRCAKRSCGTRAVATIRAEST